MIKRNITETTYEYDKEGKLIKKTIIETHEEENDTVTTTYPWTYLNGTSDCTTNKINTVPYCNTTTTCGDCGDSCCTSKSN
jgi:hypothetical protein